MKNSIFWDKTSCILVEIYRSFGETYCCHLQDRRVSQANKRKMKLIQCLIVAASLLARVVLDRERRDSTFLRNLGKLVPEYTASQPRIYCRLLNLFSALAIITIVVTCIVTNTFYAGPHFTHYVLDPQFPFHLQKFFRKVCILRVFLGETVLSATK
jgi:hypothetical protein